MLRSLARRLGWMAIKRFIVLLSRAGQAGVAVQCTALPPSMYLHIYFVPSTLTPNITGKSKISLRECLFLLIQCTQAYSFSTLFLQMINYHAYTNYFQMDPDHTLNEGPISEIGFE